MNSPSIISDITASQLVIVAGSEFIKGKVLDVGCKNKPFKRLFPECEWVGLDVRPVGEIVANAHLMNEVEDNSYDTVLCVNMLHKCEAPMVVMRQISRVLKPGGFAIVVVPNTYMEDSKTLWNISARGIDYLCAAAEMEGVKIITDGKVFSTEWREEFSGIDSNVRGWLDKMDSRYPAETLLIARKP